MKEKHYAITNTGLLYPIHKIEEDAHWGTLYYGWINDTYWFCLKDAIAYLLGGEPPMMPHKTKKNYWLTIKLSLCTHNY